MANFPTSAPTYPSASAIEVLASLGGGKGLTGFINDYNADIIALAAKLGTGSSTPVSGVVMRGTGSGTSTWGQIVMSTDVASFTSATLRGLITDETGTGAAVFATSPTIVTPTIADLTNMTHSHANAAGGGQLGTSALADASVTASKLAASGQGSFVVTSETRTSTTFGALTTAQSVTVNIGNNGIALVNIGCSCSNSTAGNYAIMGFAASGANTIAATDDRAVYNGGTTDVPFGRLFFLSGLSVGSTTFTLQFRVTATTGTFARRELSVIPL